MAAESYEDTDNNVRTNLGQYVNVVDLEGIDGHPPKLKKLPGNFPLSQGLTSPMNRVHENTKPRGKASSKKAKIRQIRTSRRAFKCLPVYMSSDLVYGSWWMVSGSIVATLISVIPLIDLYTKFFVVPTSTDVRAFDDPMAWFLSIIAGILFTVGSYAFVRAFECPPRSPLFRGHYHIQTDELFG